MRFIKNKILDFLGIPCRFSQLGNDIVRIEKNMAEISNIEERLSLTEETKFDQLLLKRRLAAIERHLRIRYDDVQESYKKYK